MSAIYESLPDIFEKQRVARSQSWKACYNLLLELRRMNLNIVTAESLTAGLIVARLVDIPTFGANIYGGFVVYDTDAKRKFLDVDTPSVYSDETAAQMAIGALLNSRAMVSLAVTGNAGPVSHGELGALGVVDIGCAIRGYYEPFVKTVRVRVCAENLACQGYYDESREDRGQCKIRFNDQFGCPSLEILTEVRALIRELTVSEAAKFCLSVLKEFGNGDLATLGLEPYDATYTTCGEPSRILRMHLPQNLEIKGIKYPDRDYGLKGPTDYDPLCSRDYEDLLKAKSKL